MSLEYINKTTTIKQTSTNVKIETKKSVFSDHNRIKLEKNNRKITAKSPNTWLPNNTLQNNPHVKEEISKEVKKN